MLHVPVQRKRCLSKFLVAQEGSQCLNLCLSKCLPQVSTPMALGPFEEDEFDAAGLGKRQAGALKVFDRAGWN